MSSWSTNVTDWETERRTDDMQSQYRALHYCALRGYKAISYTMVSQGHWYDIGTKWKRIRHFLLITNNRGPFKFWRRWYTLSKAERRNFSLPLSLNVSFGVNPAALRIFRINLTSQKTVRAISSKLQQYRSCHSRTGCFFHTKIPTRVRETSRRTWITRFRKSRRLTRWSEMFIEHKANIASRLADIQWGVTPAGILACSYFSPVKKSVLQEWWPTDCPVIQEDSWAVDGRNSTPKFTPW